MRSIWIMAKKKLVPIAKKFAALFALRLELFSCTQTHPSGI